MGRFTDFIVQENKRFLLLVVQQQTAKSAAEFFAYVLTGKRSANQRKKIQGCDFLLNGRPHAKIQLVWTKKKNRPKFNIEWLRCDVFTYTKELLFNNCFFVQGMASIIQTIEDCWDQDAEARLTAQCVAERVAQLHTTPNSGSEIAPAVTTVVNDTNISTSSRESTI